MRIKIRTNLINFRTNFSVIRTKLCDTRTKNGQVAIEALIIVAAFLLMTFATLALCEFYTRQAQKARLTTEEVYGDKKNYSQ